MAIQFKLVQKRDIKTGGKLIYPQVVNAGSISFSKLCKEIAEQSSLTEGDVKNCIDRLAYVLADHLAYGHTVSLGDIGTYGINVRGQGVSREEDFNTQRCMKRPTLSFYPGKRLREVQDNARFERVKIAAQASTTQPDEPSTGGGDEDNPEII